MALQGKAYSCLLVVFVAIASFYLGALYHKFAYLDKCLDLGGGLNPERYDICVVEKERVIIPQQIHKLLLKKSFDAWNKNDLCDENGYRYKNEKEALQTGLKQSEFGATFCPEYKMHPSWDKNKNGINDCYEEGICSKYLDYMSPRASNWNP